eukprot:TCALIF_11814-PA protein Name:"Protein of unknown function" AED:0.69 eAED:0.69 QI:0/0/0/0.33/1/1/3/0/117
MGSPDILICGNCREMFSDLVDMIEHKKHYCKLRFTCKCDMTNDEACLNGSLCSTTNSGDPDGANVSGAITCGMCVKKGTKERERDPLPFGAMRMVGRPIWSGDLFQWLKERTRDLKR